MTNPNAVETNLEKFNAQLKKTSDRVRSRRGSDPTDVRIVSNGPTQEVESSDANTDTSNDVTPASRGGRNRGRGRGKKMSTVTTRAATAARQLAEANKDTTNQTEATETRTSTANNTSSATEVQPQASQNATTTVNETQIDTQPASLISRNNVPVTPANGLAVVPRKNPVDLSSNATVSDDPVTVHNQSVQQGQDREAWPGMT
ncbi:uncharacterized protein MELLADRAFT_112616 [Melampsora larici-populina 98AG31]|uniref:Uncharacterized protein n=1 Tax=Melampsora larici-populina (strain 98AG31 / pathotype 3-4-7) TaxID=747676 RepID=F4S719_MELLP|nr:uncharacterized protein MELLADRAFT_112616 [Melampsora larici-populina 98AG31]EGF99560.1 hypothetical protein MELLADRAFT_112616 [Melampsora larici-populina 98AG31]